MPFATTARLRYRAYADADKNRVIAQTMDPVQARTGPGYVLPKTVSVVSKEVEEWISKEMMFVVIEAHDEFMVEAKPERGNKREGVNNLPQRQTWVGFMTLSNVGSPKNREVQFGISLDEPAWGRGFGTEATAWIVDYAFSQLGMHRVSLGTMGNNLAAMSLYKKVGFVEEGRQRRQVFQDGGWVDMVLMGIVEDEWQARQSSAASAVAS